MVSAAYIGWAYVGYIVTDKWALFFFNHDESKWEYVFLSWIAFIVVTNICKSSLHLC